MPKVIALRLAAGLLGMSFVALLPAAAQANNLFTLDSSASTRHRLVQLACSGRRHAVDKLNNNGKSLLAVGGYKLSSTASASYLSGSVFKTATGTVKLKAHKPSKKGVVKAIKP